MIDRAVPDSTCFIALERIGRIDLPSQVFASIFAPPAVQREIGREIPWLRVTRVQNSAVVRALETQVDEGEAEVIALAMELGDAVAILDDKKARRLGKQLGLSVMGTLGVLLRAKRRKVIPAIRPLLTELDQAGFHMSPGLLREVLRLGGEEWTADTP